MADTKITALTALTGEGISATDVIVLVDVDDTTMNASGTDKKMTLIELVDAIERLGATDHAAILGRNFLP